jgi:hypothetical protein
MFPLNFLYSILEGNSASIHPKDSTLGSFGFTPDKTLFEPRFKALRFNIRRFILLIENFHVIGWNYLPFATVFSINQ